ncbi:MULTISPECIES: hypothetical protein [Caloramator]|uniref:Ribosomal protein L7/L12 C-terminal domain-containing protein n=1 Tax=Caloramator proteoclasticus DSM 10124 TaxID=1121262 RepID=A0A1M5BS55_9CLOT|nr:MULTISPECIES: hypothetical protein [Caloramator]SHF45394.1 hypothetical protein SAMN02746091_02561 [Caloramator proteoclasticus DSM 10124]
MSQKINIIMLICSFICTILFMITKKIFLSIIWGINFILFLFNFIKTYTKSKSNLTEEELNNLNTKIKELILANRESKAIYLYMKTTGADLKDAKEYIDSLTDNF